MNQAFAESIAAVGWRFPGARILAPTAPVVLLYHGIEPAWADHFENHIRFLKRHFRIVRPDWELDATVPRERRRIDKPAVALTFDDGFRNNYAVAAPILHEHDVPALFFYSSRHAEAGKYLWFVYLRKLEQVFRGDAFSFDGESWNMSPTARQTTIRRLWDRLVNMTPHPTAMYQAIDEALPVLEDHTSADDLRGTCAGMTDREVGTLVADPLFTVGCHTVDHPYLGLCDLPEVERQLIGNKAWIENATGRPCDVVSYPIGDYSADIIKICRALGMPKGYAVKPSLHLDPQMEIPRLGVYSPSRDVLGFKVTYGHILRRLGVRV